ncbi:glycosyltransferase family 2 protein [Pseudochelatococcus sp. B33]
MPDDLLSDMVVSIAEADQSVLAALALEAYRQEKYRLALAHIDRCCRTGGPVAEYLSLRALVRDRLGDSKGSLDDLMQASAIKPPGNGDRRRLVHAALKAGDIDACLAAAAPILAAQSPPTGLLRTLEQIAPQGLGWLSAREDAVDVHLRWNGGEYLSLTAIWDDEPQTHTVRSREAGEPFEHQAVLALAWPAGASAFSATADIPILGGPLKRAHGRQEHDRIEIVNAQALPVYDRPGAIRHATVVIPVYRDFEATRACIGGVLDHLRVDEGVSVVVVNDSSPEPRLAAYIRDLANEGRITAVMRSRNGGFIAAVETALALIPTGDVILLNADTLTPPGWIAALRQVAASDPRIGTVTPLSNNGELTSFPRPFQANPMPAANVVAALDTAARRANGREAVDIPNGIGFCLYMTRACLDAVGGFGSPFLASGYYEDVDFSLRAEKAGFRNVCATGVFVGHSGSASYLDAKRGLVIRNMGEILRRFPDIRPKTDWFIAHDPLAAARERILTAILGEGTPADLAVLVSGTGHADAEAIAAACDGAREGEDDVRPLVLRFDPAFAHRVSVTSSGPLPFDLSVEIGTGDELDRLAELLRAAGVSRLLHVLYGPCVPQSLELGRKLALPCDVAVMDVSAIPRPRTRAAALFRSARRCFPGNGQVALAIGHLMPHLSPDPPLIRSHRHLTRVSRSMGDSLLAVIPLEVGAARFRDIAALAAALHRQHDERAIIVLGRTVDDASLMRMGNVVIVGETSPDEWPRLIGLYGCGAALVSGGDTSRCDARLSFVDALPVPIAARSGGWLEEALLKDIDCPLDPSLSPDAAARAVLTWLATAA